ncbi:low molecular weight protein arginine phosphatase [Bacillaceae bacterium Marseille-Q3522]|nr:low molecular weight protein arginine phosphatase [Bacillaceae bacterium Marseille-Q3522]
MYRILFVCTGNTCRSPMAEAILKHKKSAEMEVRSAGIFVQNGGQLSENTKKVLKNNGIDFTHTSNSITEELLEWATHILTMTESHKQTLITFFPKAKEKTFTLMGFVRDETKKDIADPYGGTIKDYEQTYAELTDAIGKMLDDFKK